jgi:hypothetical protein
MLNISLIGTVFSICSPLSFGHHVFSFYPMDSQTLVEII